MLEIRTTTPHCECVMDHHYHQPLWPLLEGAFDYTMNLAGELWTMIWRPVEQPYTQPASKVASQGSQKEDKSMTASLKANWSGEAMEGCLSEQLKCGR
ncbi:hypothetical protein IG631_03341 [Alternaria alternata]|nr:hypothetical protein IG631_03341 [Alternaria alternata]